MPAVQKAVKKVAARRSSHWNKADEKDASTHEGEDTPHGTNPPKPKDLSEVKLLVVPSKVPREKDGDPVLTVKMEPLVIYPARNKLPTARHGMLFR